MAERTTSHVIGTTLLGGLVGAGLAVLFAPRSGRETRQRMHEGADHLKDEARDLKDRLAEAAHQTSRKVRGEPEELQSSKSRRQSPVLSAWEEEV